VRASARDRHQSIMEQMMKLTLQMARGVSYSCASGRIHRVQQGWLKGMMTADVGACCSTWSRSSDK